VTDLDNVRDNSYFDFYNNATLMRTLSGSKRVNFN